MLERKPSEKGQILVLLVLVLIGLLGFTALAVDGGMIYADRRYMQSAADSASLAGASVAAQYFEDNNILVEDFVCNPTTFASSTQRTNAINAAIDKADVNGFDIALDPDLGQPGHDHGVNAYCGGEGPSTIDVMVMISQVTKTSFIQVITKDQQMRNTVTSVSQADPGSTAGSGAAIISTSFDCGTNDGGVKVDGGPKVTINVGGIWSNSCVEFKGTVNVEVKDTTRGIAYSDESHWLRTGCGVVDPDKCQVIPEPHSEPDPHPITNAVIPPPVCGTGAKTNITVHNGDDITKGPGNYGSITMTGGTLTLDPGLYCVSDGITINSGTLTGKGITIYFNPPVKASQSDGKISITGGLNILQAMNMETTTEPQVPGGPGSVEDMLIYVSKTTDAEISLNGNGGSLFSGTVYAPRSLIFIGGNHSIEPGKELTFKTSIIGYDVQINGTADMNITYEKDLDYSWPSSIQNIQ
jgi:hypothetical protein